MTEKENLCKLRRGKTGGEALIEGVMMKSAKRYAVSVRMEDGSIKTKVEECRPIKEKYPILGWPIIRGVAGFIESMVLSYRCLSYSADALGIDDAEPETKFEKWLTNTLGDKLMTVVMAIGGVLGVVLALGLFVGLPSLCSQGLNALFGGGLTWQLSLTEGIIKIAVFAGYLKLVSLMPDIRRTFEYHGAEHKTIFCYENGDELTPENVRKYTRFHPRCGTAFLFVMLLISILVFTMIYLIPGFNTDNVALRMLIRLPVLPLLFGLGYEFIRFAGCHDNAVIRILSQPGLWMQRLSTREPDDSQIEVAIMSLKLSLIEEFPEAEAEAAAVAPKVAKTEEAEAAESGAVKADSTVSENTEVQPTQEETTASDQAREESHE